MRAKINWCVCVLLIFFSGQSLGQPAQEEYIQVITQRSDKIVATLGIIDSIKYYQVRDILAGQYSALNAHHEQREVDIKKLKEAFVGKKEVLEDKRTQYEDEKDKELRALHHMFIAKLDHLLDISQVEGIKNGMTYGVLPLTYRSYQDMIPSLTSEHKAKILNYLLEARELAMDAPGSKEKHGVFGKFKGRINNYLSAEGYDLQAERSKWQERLAKQKEKNNQ